jgi:N-acetylmuramoyl-L-alanine amidase
MFRVLALADRRMRIAAFAAVSLCFVASLPGLAANKTSIKRQAAQSQFTRAEEQRTALNSKPLAGRTLADYKQVVSTYRRVYLITPHAPEVPDAILAVAELNTEMGDRFGRSYFQSAVDTYQFLVHQYPSSRYCQDALLRTAHLQKDRLGDPALAAKSYEQFLKLYPRSPRRREALESLAEIALLHGGGSPEPADVPKSSPAPPARGKAKVRETESDAAAAASARFSEIPSIRKISSTASTGSTRLLIDLEDKVSYSSARIKNPDRIYFDLHAARLTPDLARREISVTGDLLKAVRVAQNQAGVVRIVLEVVGVQDYTASLGNKPPQLIVDLYGSKASLRASRDANESENPQQTSRQDAAEDADSRVTVRETESATVQPAAAKKIPAEPETAVTRSISKGNSRKSSAVSDPLPVNNTSLTRGRKNGSARDSAPPPGAAQPTHDGQATLTRTLGLKIGRIVIDAGHGGHDTGTIGPTGLMEKDLCLDIALRLGKIIEQRLPSAEVVFTRSDDSYIPLEQRTQLANEAKADLFMSIHANSSHDQAARGIETYYLNLKGSPEAMDVAARENATANGGVHELQDLVKKIARTEKIDESREFARDIQDSLARRIQKNARTVKNRGVRKAPFVVLIGADMPSVLTEISFLSNPSDEQLLKKPDYRQRVADGLYQGVVSYLQSLNSVTNNLPARVPPGRSPSSSVSVEQSRNQQ